MPCDTSLRIKNNTLSNALCKTGDRGSNRWRKFASYCFLYKVGEFSGKTSVGFKWERSRETEATGKRKLKYYNKILQVLSTQNKPIIYSVPIFSFIVFFVPLYRPQPSRPLQGFVQPPARTKYTKQTCELEPYYSAHILYIYFSHIKKFHINNKIHVLSVFLLHVSTFIQPYSGRKFYMLKIMLVFVST